MPETQKARLPTVEGLNGDTVSGLKEADRGLRRDGTTATRAKYDGC